MQACAQLFVRVCVRGCVHACVRACVLVYVRACVHACVRCVCVRRHTLMNLPAATIASIALLIAAASAFPTLPEEFGLTSSAEGAADAATIVAAVAAAVAVAVTAPVTCVRAVWCVVAQCNVM